MAGVVPLTAISVALWPVVCPSRLQLHAPRRSQLRCPNLYLQLAARVVTDGKYQGLHAIGFSHNKMVPERAAKTALSIAILKKTGKSHPELENMRENVAENFFDTVVSTK